MPKSANMVFYNAVAIYLINVEQMCSIWSDNVFMVSIVRENIELLERINKIINCSHKWLKVLIILSMSLSLEEDFAHESDANHNLKGSLVLHYTITSIQYKNFSSKKILWNKTW